METTKPLRDLVVFFCLTFALSWLLWLPAVLDANGWVDLPDWTGLLGMFAPFGPSIVAFVLTARLVLDN